MFETKVYKKSVPVLYMQLVHGSTQDVENFELKLGQSCLGTRRASEQILSTYQVFIFAAV